MSVVIMGFKNHVIGEPFSPELKEPYIMYYIYEIILKKGFIDTLDQGFNCTSCGHMNILYGGTYPHILMSPYCMKCKERLLCPDCLYPLYEGLITNFESVLFCNDCGLWFPL